MHSITALSVSLLILAAGCRPHQPRVADTTTNSWDAAADYAYDQKEKFVATMQVELDKLKQEVKELGDKIERGTEKAKAEAEPQLKTLREKVSKLDDQLAAAKNSSASTWEDVKAGFKKSSDELKKSLNQARSWLSEKIAPNSPTTSTNQ